MEVLRSQQKMSHNKKYLYRAAINKADWVFTTLKHVICRKAIERIHGSEDEEMKGKEST